MVHKDTAGFVAVAAIALGLRMSGGALAQLSYATVALYALGGWAHVVRSLWLSWLLMMLNTGLVPESSASSLGRYVVLAGAVVSIVARWHAQRTRARARVTALWATLGLGAAIAVHSLLFSSVVDVSVLKTAAWTAAAAALCVAWSAMPLSERRRTEEHIYAGLVATAVLSVPLVVAGPGYLRNGTGFQGVLNHPQAFGPTMAILGAWQLAKILSLGATWLRLAGVALTLGFVAMSESRTGLFALALGILVGVAGSQWKAVHGGSARRVRIGVLAIASVLLATPFAADSMWGFLQKRSSSATVIDMYDASRGRLMRAMLANIEQRPIVGIGFGVASEASAMVVARDEMFGLPVGAAIEKGVLPLAIVEEVGVLGAVAVVAWLFVVMRGAMRGGVAAGAVSWTAVLTNLGESTLFSPGGLGLLVLMVVLWSATSVDGAEARSEA